MSQMSVLGGTMKLPGDIAKQNIGKALGAGGYKGMENMTEAEIAEVMGGDFTENMPYVKRRIQY